MAGQPTPPVSRQRAIRRLLFEDVGGAFAADPETVIDAAATDPRYLERVPGLRAVLADPGTERYHRFLAVQALASWGHAPVYPVVAATAEAGRRSPWLGMLTDPAGRDRTFPELALAVAEGRRFTAAAAPAAADGAEEARLAALRALVGLGDELFFDWQLAHAADEPAVADALAAVVDRGVDRSDEADFDRARQLAALCAVLARHDRPRAVRLAERLLRKDSRMTVRLHLAPVVPFRA
ncbi:hypothetical protein [Saccharothrix algeriensis]|uniref:HEAT repeat domain-containing protein n=1 Tax=Saccharothrix algeriensis TaxID=173560 RepID=A0A8T8I3L7_9PSEU|nr:hypothetical protein [Saccharothrix algeriensis]MBM7811026.1 hypothetical protein [Saccharothrix algeriensis]QTR04990.1 hypothetical protein J7S33_09760 [Saccharothrix algeriensis]